MNDALNVLLIEDNPGDARLIRELLAEEKGGSFRLEHVDRLSVGIERLASGKVDAVLLDLGLPDSQGFDAFIKIHNLVPQIPIVILSGLTDEALAAKTVREGAQDYLVKGHVDSNLLERALRYAIGRKQAEERLRHSEEYFRALTENSSDVTFVIDKEGTILYVSPPIERFSGYKPEELIGKSAFEFILPDDLPRAIHDLNAAIQTKDIATFNVLRVQHKDGSEHVLEGVGKNFLDNSIIAGFVMNVHDVTERNRAEEALKAERQRLHDVLEAIPIMVCLLTPDYHVAFANHAFREKFGKSHGRHCYEYCFGRKEPCDFCETYGVLKTAKPHHWQLTTPDGASVIDVYNFPFTDVDGSPMILEMDIEITERKQAEEELRKHREHLEELVEERTVELSAVNKELEAFAYSVSHDLRAPLRSIDGFSQALLEDCADKLNEQGRDHVQRVRSAAQRMGELIDDLLNLSRLTRVEMRRSKVDLSALANAVVAELRKTQPERQVEFVIAERLTVKGDAVLLRTVLENLLGNAWKFTGKQPKARIEFGVTQNEGKPAYFVHDDGVGFDMAYVDKLFAPFQRLHPVGEFPGTGIGLATVQRIIHRHRGSVWCEGRVGEGATFYFTLG